MATHARKTATRPRKSASASPSVDVSLEQRVLAFAEFAGRLAGTIQARAEGFLDPKTLTAQLSGMRDGAAGLLEYLGRASAIPTPPAPVVKSAKRPTPGRSGGVVDAPGKKHRAPILGTADATAAKRQAATMRDARTMVKTNRRRGRG